VRCLTAETASTKASWNSALPPERDNGTPPAEVRFAEEEDPSGMRTSAGKVAMEEARGSESSCIKSFDGAGTSSKKLSTEASRDGAALTTGEVTTAGVRRSADTGEGAMRTAPPWEAA